MRAWVCCLFGVRAWLGVGCVLKVTGLRSMCEGAIFGLPPLGTERMAKLSEARATWDEICALRITLHEDADDHTAFTTDQPSTAFAGFGNPAQPQADRCEGGQRIRQVASQKNTARNP
ncbi:hypothetical protein ACFYYH_18225 [Streptomyces sp. NPDC002018]|uniref:hypothetical protein n=1 Tax=Streptomyces sp. NPDC002018 TaxID=3364629 RepID=UPI0036ADBA18